MAPEILSYQKYDAKADLWSVGAVLYEMSVGRPPYRAQNHIELLKKIEASKGVKFPDESPPRRSGVPTPTTPNNATTTTTTPGAEDAAAVPDDIKLLIRLLLKRHPVERASFDDFFKSTAMVNSKFPRPPRAADAAPKAEAESGGAIGLGIGIVDDSEIPEHHLQVPPEVLDAKAMIPPSKFRFRRREEGGGGDSASSGAGRREDQTGGDGSEAQGFVGCVCHIRVRSNTDDRLLRAAPRYRRSTSNPHPARCSRGASRVPPQRLARCQGRCRQRARSSRARRRKTGCCAASTCSWATRARSSLIAQ